LASAWACWSEIDRFVVTGGSLCHVANAQSVLDAELNPSAFPNDEARLRYLKILTVSIHACRMGSDAVLRLTPADSPVSIHAPRVGR
jgi:hypothetical protein